MAQLQFRSDDTEKWLYGFGDASDGDVTIASSADFKVATSIANAQAGTVIATSGSQSGVHTMSVQVRWGSTDTIPTLTTGKYRRDTLCYIPQSVTNGVVLGYTVDKDL